MRLVLMRCWRLLGGWTSVSNQRAESINRRRRMQPKLDRAVLLRYCHQIRASSFFLPSYVVCPDNQ